METTWIVTKWNSYETKGFQSLRTWARRVTSYEEIPTGFREYFPDSEEFPYTVFIPPQRWGIFQKRPSRLLSLERDRLLILEARRGKVNAIWHPLQTITYLEYGRFLLKSWLTFTNDTSQTSTIQFNTVNERVFRPIVKAIRRGIHLPQPPLSNQQEHQKELAKLGYLNMVNYKYMNFGRESLLPGDIILRTVYQPNLCISQAHVFKRPMFKRYLTPHLSILTNRELILIKEHSAVKTETQPEYGGVFIYIPLRQIQHIAFDTGPEAMRYQLHIILSGTTSLCSEFSVHNPDVEAFHQGCIAVCAPA